MASEASASGCLARTLISTTKGTNPTKSSHGHPLFACETPTLLVSPPPRSADICRPCTSDSWPQRRSIQGHTRHISQLRIRLLMFHAGKDDVHGTSTVTISALPSNIFRFELCELSTMIVEVKLKLWSPAQSSNVIKES